MAAGKLPADSHRSKRNPPIAAVLPRVPHGRIRGLVQAAPASVFRRPGLPGNGFDFVTEEGIAAFLRGFQEIQVLEMAELWALKPALQLTLLERIGPAASTAGVSLPVLLASLRLVGECQWKELFESVSRVDSILSRDPAGAYSRMDYDSRDYYRNLIAELAYNSDLSEVEVAEAAVSLAEAKGRSAAEPCRFLAAGSWTGTAARRYRLSCALQAPRTRCYSVLAAIVLSDRHRGSNDCARRHFAGVAAIRYPYPGGAFPIDYPRHTGRGRFHEQPDELSGARAPAPQARLQ